MPAKGRNRGPYKRYFLSTSAQRMPKRTKYNRITKSLCGCRTKRPGALLRELHRKSQNQMNEVHLIMPPGSSEAQDSENIDPETETNANQHNLHLNATSTYSASNESTEIEVNEDIGVDPDALSYSSETDNSIETSSISSDCSYTCFHPEDTCDQGDHNGQEDSNAIHEQNSSETNPSDFYQSPQPNTDVHDLSQCSTKDLTRILMLLATKMRHNSTYNLAENMSEIIEALSESPEQPQTKHKLKKIVDTLSVSMSIHHFCNSCKKYAGKQKSTIDQEEVPAGSLICTNCGNEVDLSANCKAGNVFIYLSLASQLQEFFSRHGNSVLYSKTRTKESKFAIEDIYDGKLYKKLVSDDMISVNFSIDGVPIFNSSNYSMHPVLCTINELAPEKRPVTMFLCTLFCGSGNVPDINSYLTPFVAKCNDLRKFGFSYTYNGKTFQKTCQLLLGICDSLARREVRNCTLFNGRFGCGFCKHPGEQVPKGKGTVRIYPIDVHGNAFGEGLRTHADTLLHAHARQMGIQGQSILCDEKFFDIVRHLPPEWQHNTGLGVVRQFTNLMFNSLYHDKPFYFGSSLSLVDELLLSFKPSIEVSRTPRRMSERSHWKAHEWVVFLLFYSSPIFQRILPKRYVQHWALLVDGISILMSTSIMPSEVFYAKQCLFQFVQGVEDLYGKKNVSYNVHLLTHLPQSVLDWGPLWTHSAFGYENYYQNLLAFVHSSQTPSLQICNSFRLQIVVNKLYDLCKSDLTTAQKNCVNKLLQKKTYPKVTLRLKYGSLVGKPKIAMLKRQDFLALQRINVQVDSKQIVRYFNRMILNREVFHTTSYTRPSKRRSYYVLLKNSEVFQIERFVVFCMANTEQCYAIGHYFKKHHRPLISGRRLTHITVLKNKIDTLAAVSAEFIKEKILFVEMHNFNLILACRHPNHCELLT